MGVGSVEVDVSKLKVLEGLAGVAEVTGFSASSLDEINKSGIWRVLSGSRRCLDEIEYVGPLEQNTINLPSENECIDLLTYGGDDEEEVDRIAEYVEEFYGIMEEEDSVQFGYTEEEFDYYVKVKI